MTTPRIPRNRPTVSDAPSNPECDALGDAYTAACRASDAAYTAFIAASDAVDVAYDAWQASLIEYYGGAGRAAYLAWQGEVDAVYAYVRLCDACREVDSVLTRDGVNYCEGCAADYPV